MATLRLKLGQHAFCIGVKHDVTERPLVDKALSRGVHALPYLDIKISTSAKLNDKTLYDLSFSSTLNEIDSTLNGQVEDAACQESRHFKNLDNSLVIL